MSVGIHQQPVYGEVLGEWLGTADGVPICDRAANTPVRAVRRPRLSVTDIPGFRILQVGCLNLEGGVQHGHLEVLSHTCSDVLKDSGCVSVREAFVFNHDMRADCRQAGGDCRGV